MVNRYIGLPAIGRKVRIRDYVAAVRFAKANPRREFKHGFTCWWPVSGAEVYRQFLASMHERINDAVPYSKRGLVAAAPQREPRKMAPEYQTMLRRDCWAVREYRRQRLVRPGGGLETAETRRRFPDVHARFRERE